MRIFRHRPLVSVIMASYNHAPYVTKAVSTVLGQGVDDLELIVVDDGSSDGTPDKVDGLRDRRVRLIRLEENRRTHPRNLALGLARGKYVAFQNSDDEWADGKLTAQLKVLEKDSKIAACFTGVEIIGESGNILTDTYASGVFTTTNQSSAKWLRYFFESGNCLCLPSAVVRRRQVEMVGRFRPHLVQLGDLDLWVRLAAMGDFHIIGQALTRMRVVGNSNFSGPSPDTSRRSALEFAEVLQRYTAPPVRERILEIFQDILPEQPQSLPANIARVAIHAWSLSPTHRLFADRVLAGMLDDPTQRGEMIRAFGVNVVHDFIRKRGELEIVLHNEGGQ